MLPELVPPIASIFMLFSSNAFRTPACAIPLIPPPDNAIGLLFCGFYLLYSVFIIYYFLCF